MSDERQALQSKVKDLESEIAAATEEIGAIESSARELTRRREELLKHRRQLRERAEAAKLQMAVADLDEELEPLRQKGAMMFRVERPHWGTVDVWVFTPPTDLRVIRVESGSRTERKDIRLADLAEEIREKLDRIGVWGRVYGGRRAHRPTCPNTRHSLRELVDPEVVPLAACCVGKR